MQPNLSEIFQMLAQTVQTSAVGLNYHIVVPCVNGALFYFLVHCLCLYFHVNILFSSSKYSRSHPDLAFWKSAPQQANQMVSKSSDFLCCFMSALQHSRRHSKGFFSPFRHTFLWFPKLMLILMRSICTVKQLQSMGMIEEDDLLLKTQVNDLIKDDQSKNCVNYLCDNQNMHLFFQKHKLEVNLDNKGILFI